MEAVDKFFTGEIVLAVPPMESEYQRKVPGASDVQGDYCSSN